MPDRIIVIGASLNGISALAARLSTLPEEREDAAHVTYLQERAARLRGEAEQISAWMRTTSGLVDPEP